MLESGYLQMEGRISIWKDTLHLVRDYPLTGAGLGTFGLAFRHYQTDLVNLYVDHAHNDYLEFAADTGLLGVALLFLPILYLFFKMIVSFLVDPRRYRPAVTLGCIGSTLGMLIHSATDFNLQIPANALIFAVVLGMGYKAACVERRTERQAGGSSTGRQRETRGLQGDMH
jgi:O-antigen ligase